jgi:hypothetical protein
LAWQNRARQQSELCRLQRQEQQARAELRRLVVQYKLRQERLHL